MRSPPSPGRPTIKPHERFGSEWSFVLVALGITLGTGNVWRFPRIIAQEGGVFLIPWALGIAFFCYPLLLGEAALGQRTRLGLVGALAHLGDRRRAWIGTFLAIATLGVLCFDAVVSGWCIRYFVQALTSDLFASPLSGQTFYQQQQWQAFAGTWDAVPYGVVALALAWIVVSRGVRRGIEPVHRFAVPLVFLVLFVLAMRALTLDGVARGLASVFEIRWSRLGEAHLWYRGLLQAMGTTAAGWGWMLTYSSSIAPGTERARAVGRVVIGSALASLLATVALVPLAYGAEVPDAVRRDLVSRAGGFVFVWVPTLLGRVPWGPILAILLYGALAIATVLTLVAQLETVVRICTDLGAERARIAGGLALLAAVLGLPCALSMKAMDAQSWIFGTLLIAGPGLLAYAIARHGGERLYREVFEPERRPGIPRSLFGPAFQLWIPLGSAALVVGQIASTMRTPSAPAAAALGPGGLGTLAIGVVAALLFARWFTPELVRRTYAASGG